MEQTEKLLETKDLAFLNYTDQNGLEQIKVFQMIEKKFYVDIVDSIPYILNEEAKTKIVNNPKFIHYYTKQPLKYQIADLFTPDSISESEHFDDKLSTRKALMNIFQSLAFEYPQLSNKIKNFWTAGRLSTETIDENTLKILTIRANQHMKTKQQNPTHYEHDKEQ